MSEWTKEPWDTGPITGAGEVWVYSRGSPLAEPASPRDWRGLAWRAAACLFKLRRDVDYRYGSGCLGDGAWKIQEANAARIVACVNALAGVPDPARAVEAARVALCEAIERLQCAVMDSRDLDTVEKCRSALAGLGGGTP